MASSWVTSSKVVPLRSVEVEHQFDDLLAGGRVEVTGRFVGQYQPGIGAKREPARRVAARHRRGVG